MERLRQLLDLCREYPEVKRVWSTDGHTYEIEFHELRHSVSLAEPPFNLTDSLPPDDVMLFAATEDVDELMKERLARPADE